MSSDGLVLKILMITNYIHHLWSETFLKYVCYYKKKKKKKKKEDYGLLGPSAFREGLPWTRNVNLNLSL